MESEEGRAKDVRSIQKMQGSEMWKTEGEGEGAVLDSCLAR
jgi:hypothetical protein